jgi:hypothetical protein
VYTAGNYYKVYAVDKAFNYSNEIVISDATLSLEDVIVSDFKVYPNPAKDFISIESTDQDQISTVQVFDVLGKEVMNTRIQNNRLNVSNLSKGMYILKINSVNGNGITKKVIIE